MEEEASFIEIPRSIIYKDTKDLNRFLGSQSEESLEREFYKRLYTRSFIRESDNPLELILTVFNNACYIRVLIVLENLRFDHLINYIEKAADSTDDPKLKLHITAATMALVYNLLPFHVVEDKSSITKFQEEIFIYFGKYGKYVTSESQNDFYSLLIRDSLPSVSDEPLLYMRNLVDAEIPNEIPIQDVAMGIDFIIECYDSSFDTNKECQAFMANILDRLEDEASPECDMHVLELAKEKVKKEKQLRKTMPDEDSELHLSFNMLSPEEIDNLYCTDVITPEMEENLGWIVDKELAPIVLRTLRYYMKGKSKPKDLLMPLCAALRAHVIRKPSPKEFDVVFSDFPRPSNTSLVDLVSIDREWHYTNNQNTEEIYKSLVQEFTKIKKK